MQNIQAKRVTIFSGHYGSGKTNVAVSFAKLLKSQQRDVAIYDLDIVNPYFRTIDAEKELSLGGVELVVSPFAETNVDIPAMNAKSYQMLADKSKYAVIDLGGDDRGALAMGRFSSNLKEEDNYDFLLVLNKYRPETRDVDGVKAIIKEIEFASKIKFTGIVNNTNLGSETTEEIILEGYEFAKQVAKETGLEIKFTSVEKRLYDKIKNKIEKLISVDLIKYGDWI